MSLTDQRRSELLAAVKRHDPQHATLAEAVIDDLLAWSSAHPDLAVIDRHNVKDVLQVALKESNRIIWAARTFKTTGTFIALLGWGSDALDANLEADLISRLNVLRRDEPLRSGAELRVRIADLDSPQRLQQLKAALDQALARARAAA